MTNAAEFSQENVGRSLPFLGGEMVNRANFADSLVFALHLLEWSPKQLADHVSGDYRVKYLARVCEGRPIGDVEADIVRAIMYGLAEKLKRSIIKSEIPNSENVGQVAGEAFVRTVRRFDLQLSEITRLAEVSCLEVESAHSFRTQTLSISDVDFWDDILGDIALDLSQGKLFQGEHIRVHSLDEISLLPDRPMPLDRTVVISRRTNYYTTPPDQCWNCHSSTSELTSARCHCGKSWNIPD